MTPTTYLIGVMAVERCRRAANNRHAVLTIAHRRLLRQFFAGLLAHRVLAVTIWPVGVGFPSPRFMLPVRHRGASQRLGKVAHRRICRVA
jgi:hypothetical protein